jgi:hypothetical protein
MTATIRPRRRAFMAGSVGLLAASASGRSVVCEVQHDQGQPEKVRGARWNRTTDLILIRDAL